MTDVQTNSHVGLTHFANMIGSSRFGVPAAMYKKDERPDQSANTIVSSRFGATAEIYKNVKPAEFGDLRDRFIDTSLLKKAPRSEHRQTPPAKAMPPTPQEAARKALVTAFTERESSRVQLNANYSIPHALEFDEKAKAYNMMREKLARLMPGKDERRRVRERTHDGLAANRVEERHGLLGFYDGGEIACTGRP